MSKIQVMLVPEDEGSVRSFWIPRNYMQLCVAVLTGGALLCLGSAVAYYEFWKGRQAIEIVSTQNEVLREHLEDTGTRLAQVAEDVAQSESLEQEARLLAGLEPLDGDTRRLGVGGPVIDANVRPSLGDPTLNAQIERQEDLLGELERRVAFQKQSYRETLDILRDQRETLDRTPTISPLRDLHTLTSGFGWRVDPFTGERAFHRGLDLRAPSGSPVYATAAGKVVWVGPRGDFGLTVTIDHGDGLLTQYSHLASIEVEENTDIERGFVIGTVGSTGRSTGPHVHYEVLKDGIARDPRKYILAPEVVVD